MPKRFANVQIAPSTEAAEFMFGKGCVQRDRAHILHNGVDLSEYRYSEDYRKSIRQELGMTKDVLVVGHVGRFNQQKNHGFLLEIFKAIQEKNENSILLLVGQGEQELDIRKKASALGISAQIVFMGVRADVPQLLSAMDVFVFPSLYEGMPNTVIEAQATGLPCVIADTITREADITGLVRYMSLQDAPELWAQAALDAVSPQRKNTKQAFLDHKYDIQSTVDQFVQLCFGE